MSAHKADWYVYVLRNKRTGDVYTGVTNDPVHRLRAHQCHITGGVSTTRKWVSKHGAESVTMYLLVGPMDGTSAMSLEHKWKKTRVSGPAGIQGRIKALLRLLGDAEDRNGYLTGKCTIGPGVSVSTVCTSQGFADMMKNPKDPNSIVHLPRIVQWRFDRQLPDPGK